MFRWQMAVHPRIQQAYQTARKYAGKQIDGDQDRCQPGRFLLAHLELIDETHQ